MPCVLLLTACQQHIDVGECGSPTTAVHLIQGNDHVSPLLGQLVQLEVNTTLKLDGDDDSPSGVFAQQPDGSHDNDQASSEGIFLLDESLPVNRRIRVAGVVTESGDERQSLTAIEVHRSMDCGAATTTALELSLPFRNRHIESLEGMLIALTHPVTISGVSGLRRDGELIVAAGGRLFQPTERVRPGHEAEKLRRDNLRRSLIIDDTSLESYPQSIPLYTAKYPTAELPRVGDTLTSVTGVLNQRRGYRLHLTQPVSMQQRSPSFALPGRTGNLRVAGFNLLNLFNGNGRGGGYPTERGARTAREQERQLSKTVAAMVLMDADIFALSELENDAHQQDSAVSELVEALNATSGDHYRAVSNPDPDSSLGDDSIAVGIIYRSSVLEAVADSETLSTAPFDDYNRPPLLQRFVHSPTGQKLAVVSLHLKSKSCRDAEGINADQRDGQGCWNAKRLEASHRLTMWADELDDVDAESTLFIGDLNAYTLEQPVQQFVTSGYQNLVQLLGGDERGVSYVYRGQAGSLDHAMAGSSLINHAEQAFIWPINAGVSDFLDYRQLDFRDDWSAPEHWRSSDHNPVLIDFDLPPFE